MSFWLARCGQQVGHWAQASVQERHYDDRLAKMSRP